ncbi:MAG: hypothetical protein U1E89_22160 [Burkholderiaceae bacterium]
MRDLAATAGLSARAVVAAAARAAVASSGAAGLRAASGGGNCPLDGGGSAARLLVAAPGAAITATAAGPLGTTGTTARVSTGSAAGATLTSGCAGRLGASVRGALASPADPPGHSFSEAVSATSAPAASTATVNCAGDSSALVRRTATAGLAIGTDAAGIATPPLAVAATAGRFGGAMADMTTTSVRSGTTGGGTVAGAPSATGSEWPQAWQKCDSAPLIVWHCGQKRRNSPAPQVLQ